MTPIGVHEEDGGLAHELLDQAISVASASASSWSSPRRGRRSRC